MRRAVIKVWSPKNPAEVAETVARYLPSGYRVAEVAYDEVIIEGEDNAGWTLDGYVIPRLQSGGVWPTEVKPMDPGKLDDLMEIDHVIRVHEFGYVTEPGGVWAPEVSVELDKDGQIVPGGEQAMIAEIEREPNAWEVMKGYTSQQGGGSIMHSSESVGGQLARDILERPGLYVVCEPSGLYPSEEAEEADSGDPIGWVILRREASEAPPRAPHGYLADYKTGERIRPATADELARTEEKLASFAPDGYTGAWRDADGRVVYVENGGSRLLSWSVLWSRLVTAGVHPDVADGVVRKADTEGRRVVSVAGKTLTVTKAGDSRFRLEVKDGE